MVINFQEWWNRFKEENRELESYEYYRLDTSEELVQKGWNAASEKADKKIEQLRKEKEWLANKVIRMGFMLDILPFGERKKVLTEEMQQALKERE